MSFFLVHGKNSNNCMSENPLWGPHVQEVVLHFGFPNFLKNSSTSCRCQ